MKKYLYYLPHVVLGIIILQAAIGKLVGADMSVALFEQLNLLGAGGDVSRIALGIIQVILVVSLFCKKNEVVAATLLGVNMIGAWILVGTDTLSIIAFVLALVVILKHKKCEGECCKRTCKTEEKKEHEEEHTYNEE
jgi:hypothetical protein